MYDILEYIVPNCNVVIGNEISNDIFWFVSRSTSMYLWVIPIVYIFWPLLRTRPWSYLGSATSPLYKSTGLDNSQKHQNKINNTHSNRDRNLLTEERSSIISSLDEELSDDDDFY